MSPSFGYLLHDIEDHLPVREAERGPFPSAASPANPALFRASGHACSRAIRHSTIGRCDDTMERIRHDRVAHLDTVSHT